MFDIILSGIINPFLDKVFEFIGKAMKILPLEKNNKEDILKYRRRVGLLVFIFLLTLTIGCLYSLY